MPTLNWLIRESKLNNLRLITGENHILQEISSVNVLDNPDVLKWFKKDELVLTTGFPFKDNSDKQQRQMIRDLKQIGCTALAIKTKRYFSRIPSAIIEEAETLDFPIIELPYFYSFSEISRINLMLPDLSRTRQYPFGSLSISPPLPMPCPISVCRVS